MKLFLASTVTRELFKHDLLLQIKYVLESYFYIEDWQLPLIRDVYKQNFILDSGAYTFMQSSKGGSSYQSFLDYTKRYAHFINKHDIKLFFEMDVDSIIGLDKVEDLRHILETETGKKPIPVWHMNRGKEYFIQSCKDYDYVALGGIAGGETSFQKLKAVFPWFIQTAHQNKAKIHGLGCTFSNIADFDFDSVDSSTWLSGGRFGQLHQFNGSTIVPTTIDGKRAKDYKQIDRHNLTEWIKFQYYLDSKRTLR